MTVDTLLSYCENDSYIDVEILKSNESVFLGSCYEIPVELLQSELRSYRLDRSNIFTLTGNDVFITIEVR